MSYFRLGYINCSNSSWTATNDHIPTVNYNTDGWRKSRRRKKVQHKFAPLITINIPLPCSSSYHEPMRAEVMTPPVCKCIAPPISEQTSCHMILQEDPSRSWFPWLWGWGSAAAWRRVSLCFHHWLCTCARGRLPLSCVWTFIWRVTSWRAVPAARPPCSRLQGHVWTPCSSYTALIHLCSNCSDLWEFSLLAFKIQARIFGRFQVLMMAGITAPSPLHTSYFN